MAFRAASGAGIEDMFLAGKKVSFKKPEIGRFAFNINDKGEEQ
jgi:hypothetical protein